jgi:uncharacterized membrane protein YfcA
MGSALLLVGAAGLAGALNSVAGGGSFFTFPALIVLGIPPIAANATSTVALWPGSLASAFAYRRELREHREGLPWLSLVSLVGGSLGAWLLLRTGDTTFARLIPWLLLTATALFAASGLLVPRLRARNALVPHGSWRRVAGVAVQLAIAIYGGYFGGGIGILMLAAFALAGQTDIHVMNARKSWLGALMNGVAVVTFTCAGAVRWHEAAIMVLGAIAGGYGGARLARRVDPRLVRRLVVASGSALTAWFFLRS